MHVICFGVPTERTQGATGFEMILVKSKQTVSLFS